MQSSKIENLIQYNDFLKLAVKGSPDFPDKLCEFLITTFDIQASVLLTVNENDRLIVSGKSSEVKKSFTPGKEIESDIVKDINNKPQSILFNTQFDSNLNITDFVLFEGYLFIKLPQVQILFLLAKKTPFGPSDKLNLETSGEFLGTLFSIWKGNESGFNTSLSKIVSDIGHELRTPVNSIMGFASLLNEDSLTPSQAEYVYTLKESAYNILSLINDLIDIAKVETGLIKESKNDTNIRDLITEVVSSLNDKVDKNKLDFIIKYEKDLPEILKLDSQKLKFILLNILTYSVRLTDKGKISLSLSMLSPEKLNIKISDTSSGFSASKLKEVFTPFSLYELGNTKIGNSTGLGLTLSKKYSELIDAEFEVISSVGKGTTYNLSIKTERIALSESSMVSSVNSGKKNRVLVVEDDYATSKLLSNYLTKWGYDPLIVNSADQTLKTIEKESFLAILMDIVLPDSNGFELLKKVRENKKTKNTPVIVCSVEAEQQKAFLMGAVEYFVKPVKYNYLVEVLQSYKLKKDSNILIVDDDVPTLNLIKEAVQQSGFNAIAEARSANVMSVIETMNLDLAIVDLDMPEINGFDLIKEIKSNPKFLKLPILIYTGKENYKEDLKKIDGLFEDLLEKSSVNIENLSDIINEMINRFDEPPAALQKTQQDKEVVKILLVEDYKHSQIIVTRLLKKNNFEYIVVVENGAEALEQVKKQQFDLILMDMQMPVMNGFEATEKIRKIPEYQDTPIIALTAFAMKGDREKCLEAGATDYIPKPIDSHEFIEKVKFYTESKVSVSQ